MFDNYGHKWYVPLIEWFILISIGFLFFVVIGIIGLSIPQRQYHYEYVDLNNNEGIAKECSYKFKEYKRGGQGSPVCELADGTVKQVKEYKQIYDGTVAPIKEIFK